MDELHDDNLSVNDLTRIFSNPFYCITACECMCQPHPPLVSEEVWVKVGVNLIKEIGPEKYLRNLLENLKGNHL